MCIFIEIFSKRMSAPQIYKSTSLHFKDIDTVQGIVQGYFANFGTVDSDGDIFTPDCFNKSIIENGPKSQKPRIKHLLDHNRQNAVAVLQELYADATGLAYVSKAGSHTAGQDFLKMCMDGIITEHSVGINYIFDKIKVQEDGSALLLEVRLWEGSSLQTWGANQNTPLTGVKSLGQAEDYILTLQKALKKGTYTDETFVQLQKLHDTISEIIKGNTTEPPVTQPTAAVFDKNKFLHELSNALK